MALTVTVAGVSLPCDNLTDIKVGNELIWSSNTGRSASSGKMLGDIVAKKKTISLTYSWLSRTDFNTIDNALNTSSFFAVKVELDSFTLLDADCYRSNIERELGGKMGGTWYWKSVTFDLIQQ